MSTKKDNERILATATQRALASFIRESRDNKRHWETLEKELVSKLRADVGKVDVTLVTENRDEVASITETDAKVVTVFDYERYFADHPAERATLEADYATRTVSNTQVRTLTKWIETNPEPLA